MRPRQRITCVFGLESTSMDGHGTDFQPEDFIRRRRDSGEETALARQLRSLAAHDRHLFVRRLLECNLSVGLKMIRCTVTDRTELRSIFVSRLSDLDAGVTQIGAWVRTFLPKLGCRAVIHILRDYLEVDPLAVGRALYFLGPLIPRDDASRSLADELWSMAQERNAILGPMIVPDPHQPGKYLFRQIPHEYKKPPPGAG